MLALKRGPVWVFYIDLVIILIAYREERMRTPSVSSQDVSQALPRYLDCRRYGDITINQRGVGAEYGTLNFKVENAPSLDWDI